MFSPGGKYPHTPGGATKLASRPGSTVGEESPHSSHPFGFATGPLLFCHHHVLRRHLHGSSGTWSELSTFPCDTRQLTVSDKCLKSRLPRATVSSYDIQHGYDQTEKSIEKKGKVHPCTLLGQTADTNSHFSGKPSWAGKPPSPVEPSGNWVVMFGSHRFPSLFFAITNLPLCSISAQCVCPPMCVLQLVSE